MVTIQDTEYLTAQQVADRYGVARQTVYHWINNDKLAGVIDAGPDARTRYLIPAAALDGFELPSDRGPGWKAGRRRG